MRKFLLSFPLCITILAVAITAYSFENTTDNVTADIKGNYPTLFAEFSTKGDINITRANRISG